MRDIYKTILLIFVIFSLILSFPVQQSEEIVVSNDNNHHEYITYNHNYTDGKYFIVEMKSAARMIIEVSIVENPVVFTEKVRSIFISNIDDINEYIPFYGKINHRKQLPRCNTSDEVEHFEFQMFFML